jgi:hypothetical protein
VGEAGVAPVYGDDDGEYAAAGLAPCAKKKKKKKKKTMRNPPILLGRKNITNTHVRTHTDSLTCGRYRFGDTPCSASGENSMPAPWRGVNGVPSGNGEKAAAGLKAACGENAPPLAGDMPGDMNGERVCSSYGVSGLGEPLLGVHGVAAPIGVSGS